MADEAVEQPEPLKTADAVLAEAYSVGGRKRLSKEEAARNPWLQKLRAGDLTGPVLHSSQYIRLRSTMFKEIRGIPRTTRIVAWIGRTRRESCAG